MVLGVLRGHGEAGQPLAPQPDLTGLTTLVDAAREVGEGVSLAVTGGRGEAAA